MPESIVSNESEHERWISREYVYQDAEGRALGVVRASYERVKDAELPEDVVTSKGGKEIFLLKQMLVQTSAGTDIDLLRFLHISEDVRWYCYFQKEDDVSDPHGFVREDKNGVFIFAPEPINPLNLMVGIHEAGHAHQLTSPKLRPYKDIFLLDETVRVMDTVYEILTRIATTFQLTEMLPTQAQLQSYRRQESLIAEARDRLIRVGAEIFKLEFRILNLYEQADSLLFREMNDKAYFAALDAERHSAAEISDSKSGHSSVASLSKVTYFNLRWAESHELPPLVKDQYKLIKAEEVKLQALLEQRAAVELEMKNLQSDQHDTVRNVFAIVEYPGLMLERDANLFAHRISRALRKCGFNLNAPIPHSLSIDLPAGQVRAFEYLRGCIHAYGASSSSVRNLYEPSPGRKTIADLRRGT